LFLLDEAFRMARAFFPSLTGARLRTAGGGLVRQDRPAAHPGNQRACARLRSMLARPCARTARTSACAFPPSAHKGPGRWSGFQRAAVSQSPSSSFFIRRFALA
ncbi:MAG: hypothetical protein ACK56I_06430, partial [bacterium]